MTSERPDATLTRLRRGAGTLATAAVRRMDERLPWYRALPPEDRSWVGLVAQQGIAAFVSWYDRPGPTLDLTADVFGIAPRELMRSISLQQTLEMLRTVVDAVEDQALVLAAPGGEDDLRQSMLRFSREVAFAAAEVYARAAELRGAWDARLEALVDLLSPKGTIWVHLDWRAAYLVRAILDEVLGRDAFLNEIVWRRAGS